MDDKVKHLQNNLPRVPGILNRSKYFNAAVLVLIVRIAGEFHLLFEVRKASIRQGGEVCFPGGQVDEADMDAVETALRETCEELKICEDQVEVVGRMDSLVATMGSIVDIVVGCIDEDCLLSMIPNSDEVERCFTLPITFFENQPPQIHKIRIEAQPSYLDLDGKERILLPSKQLGLPIQYHQPWGYKTFPVYVYETPEGVIWGMTAEIIHDFISKWSSGSIESWK